MNVSNIYIPVAGLSGEYVAVPMDQLPEDPEDLLDILRAEESPLILWLDFAKAYLARNKAQQFVHILTEGTSQEAQEFFKHAKFERIQIFCGLAAYYTALAKSHARSQQDRHLQQDYLLKANTLLVQARKIDTDEQLTYVGLGQLALVRGDVAGAKREFETGVNKRSNGSKNISCLLSLARITFNQGQYKEALKLYCKALSDHPNGPAEVRVGIAASYFKMGQFDKARTAYERVLELNPNCCEAMLGLALLEFNSDTSEGSHRGLNLLCDAYESSPHNPLVLNLLGHVSLIRGSYEQVKVVAQAALANCDVDSVSAQSATLLARAQHATGNITEAYRMYQQATKMDPKAPLPRFGLAQMLVRQRELTNAISLLEDVLGDAPGWIDALQILGALYPHVPGKGSKAVVHFQEAVQKESKNAQLWQVLGELLAHTDPAGALAAFKKAVEVYREAGGAPPGQANGTPNGAGDEAAAGEVPAKLLNNTAVLLMRGGGTVQAFEMMQEAMESIKEEEGSGAEGSAVTVAYNLARIQEARGDLLQAEAGYKSILKTTPGYVDCLLRLACIARTRNDLKAAIEWADKAVKAKAGHQDAVALLASLHMERKEWQTAQELFQQLMRSNNSDKFESYSSLALANLNLYTTPSDIRKPEAKSKAESHLWHAMDLYRKVLEKEPGNIYAANGLGAVVAESGHMDQAKEMFIQVQESAAASDGFMQVPDLWVNLAHVYLAQQNYVSAVKMYTNALKKFFHNHNADVLLYLARAHYDSDNLDAAKRALLRAVHLNPTDHKLRFNVALTMQEFAVRTLKKKRVAGDPTKCDDFERSVLELAQAHRFFNHLRKCGQQKTTIEDKKLKSHIDFCEQTHAKAQHHAAKAREEREVLDAKLQQQLLILEADKKKKEMEQEKDRAAEQLAIEERERQARDNARKLAMLREKWREDSHMRMAAEEGDGSKVKKKGGGRKKQKEEDDFIDDAGLHKGSDEEYRSGGEEGDGRGYGDSAADNPLKAAGLETSDEEEEGQLNGEEEPQVRRTPPAETTGRLKRHRDGGGGGDDEDGAQLPSDLEDDDVDEGADGGDGERPQVSGRKRLRKAAVLSESDDEKEGGAAAVEDDTPMDGLFGDDDD